MTLSVLELSGEQAKNNTIEIKLLKRINKIKNSQLSDAQRAEFKLAFALFDHDSNGEVEPWELAKALSIFVSHHRHALFLAVRHR